MTATEQAPAETGRKKLSPEEKAARKAAKKAQKAAEKAARPAPAPFRQSVDATHLNGDSLLTTHDVFAIGYNEDTHASLERKDFATEALWSQFRALVKRRRAAELIADAQRLEREAQDTANIADPAKRSAVKKLQKVVANFAELAKMLQSEGVNVADLLKGTGLEAAIPAV